MFDALFKNPQAMQQMDLAMALMSQGKGAASKGIGKSWYLFRDQQRSNEYTRMMDEAIREKRKREEQEAKDRQASMASVMDPSLMAMWMQDPQMRQAMQQLMGYQPGVADNFGLDAPTLPFLKPWAR